MLRISVLNILFIHMYTVLNHVRSNIELLYFTLYVSRSSFPADKLVVFQMLRSQAIQSLIKTAQVSG